jgi:CubicO group peptidase (beta-lactamase class C family)
MLEAMLVARRALGVVLAALIQAGPAQAQQSPLQAEVDQARAAANVPGMAAVTFTRDAQTGRAASGVRRVGDTAPLTGDELWHLGSETKAMTATMIATLVQQGRLSWHSRPVKVLPELAGHARRAYRRVTLQQLLSHRAGIRPWESATEFPKHMAGSATRQRRLAARSLLGSKPIGPVGRFRYSNGGYVLAAAMAERVTGRSWEHLMQERLFGPLGIGAVTGWPLDAGAGQPAGHILRGGAYAPVTPSQYRLPVFLRPAGDVSLTLHDYVRFAQLHLGAQNPAIVSAATLARLHAPTGRYALGWVVQGTGAARVLAHEGSAGTFDAVIVLVPARSAGVIAVTNAGGVAADKAIVDLALKLARALQPMARR